ncbi:MAG: PfkB family carbohydrate kinase [Steroidobacteraceae bacterium]
MKSPSRHYDFITVGNYTKDTIVSAAGTRHVDGGGYNYAAHAAALAGLTVAAVTRRAVEDCRVTAPLTSAGIDVFAYDSPNSTLMRLEYPTANVDERILSVAAVADPIGPEQLNGLSAHTILVTASIRGEVSLPTLQRMKDRCERMAIDVQGFVRVVSPEGRLRYEAWPERNQVLGMTDILKTDAVEAEFLTGTPDIRAAARALAALGPREIVLTHKDGLLVLADGEYLEAAFFPAELRGRSGRGDTCVGSYASRRISAEPPEAARWAAAVTSLKLEAEGPIRRSRADVDRLLRERY